MIKQIFFLLSLIGYGLISKAQKLPPILQKLADTKTPVLVFRMDAESIIPLPDLPPNYYTSGQEIIKTKDNLFVLPQGTGRIYQLEQSNDAYSWKRIDSTVFFGYNFNSVAFYIDSTFYSYGGHGFWNTNGNLRVFNLRSREWVAASLSETIYSSFAFLNDRYYYIDTLQKKLYIKTYPFKHDAGLKENRDSVYGNRIFSLDIKTGKWECLGRCEFATHIIAQTPWGALTSFKYIINIHENKIYEVNNEVFQNLLALTGTSTKDNIISIAYCIDSTLYIGTQKGRFDSIALSRNDLIDTGMPFYKKENAESFALPSPKAEWAIIAVLSLLTSFFYWRFRKYKSHVVQKEPDVTQQQATEMEESIHVKQHYRSAKFTQMLDEREKILLNLLYDHSSDERLTSIEEINHVIGVSNRSTEIQKRLRSDLIISINSKLNILHSEKKPVVDKQRSEFDKRSFEYFIQPVHMELVEKVLGVRS